MMKRIMKPRAAALALAAPLLLTAPALADHGKSSKSVNGTISVQTENGGLYLNIGDQGYRSYGYNTRRHSPYGYGHDGYYVNDWGQTKREVRRLKRRAIRACRAAIRDEAHYRGFHDVDFEDGRRARQIGPKGFRVTFHEVEFEGRRRDIDRQVTCVVRRGDHVKRLEGLPSPRGRGYNDRRGYSK